MIALALKVRKSALPEQFTLKDVIDKWLNQNYDTDKFGPPCWKTLLTAVAEPNGGANKALAKRLAEIYKRRDKPGVYSEKMDHRSEPLHKPPSNSQMMESSNGSIATDGSDDPPHNPTNTVDSDWPRLNPNPVPKYPNKSGAGLVLVFCNYDFVDPDDAREGADKDIERIKRTFEKYRVEVMKNKRASEVKECFQNLEKELLSKANYDCFICFFSSHGDNRGILCSDNQFVKVQELADHLHADKCSSLKGKPKLFFIQACRGNKTLNQVRLDNPANRTANQTVSDSRKAIPPGADFFFGYSSISNSPSLRGTVWGSYYILELCETIATYKKLTLYDTVTIVHEKIATDDKYAAKKNEEKGIIYRQMPEMVSTLRKHFYFQC